MYLKAPIKFAGVTDVNDMRRAVDKRIVHVQVRLR